MRRTSATLFVISSVSLIVACDGDDTVAPNPRKDAGTLVDATTGSVDSGGPSNGTLCAKYGGIAGVNGIVKSVLAAAKADCKIGQFFTGLALDEAKHLEDCFTTQVGEFMGCDGVKYAGANDTVGQPCRSMQEAHQIDPPIRSADFDAFMIDVTGALKAKGLSADDVSAIAPSFLATKNDVVQSGDDGNAQSTCPTTGGDAGRDTGAADTGADTAPPDTGIADAADAG